MNRKTVFHILICLVVPLSISGCAGRQATKLQGAPVHEEIIPAACKGPCVISTLSGATMPVPDLFSAERTGNVVELLEPDGAVKTAMVEVKSYSCKKALKAAWKEAAPLETWEMERRSTPPPPEGYNDMLVETYVRKSDGTEAKAIARRKDGLVWVALVRGPAADLDKRAAQVGTFITGLKVPKMKEIDLTGITPKSISQSRGELSVFIRDALRQTGTPGLEIAVIEGGRIAFAGGFGVHKLGKEDEVTPDTLMMIGSVTKSLTTLMMATLVDQGKFKWTTRVRDVLPDFKMADPRMSEILTMEQLVCACAGLPRKDLPLILSFEGKNCGDLLNALSKITPSTGLRETFQYQNQMVAAGGYISAHAFRPDLPMDQAYNAAMADRVFGPIGMTSTTLDLDSAIKSENHAMPHSTNLEGVPSSVPIMYERFASYVGPSGGVWSNVRDMARYVITELQNGLTPDGARIVSESNLLYRRKPQVMISADTSYGLGWMVARMKGLQIVSHDGGTMGFASNVTFIPEKGIGVVMISNGTGGHIAEDAILNRLMELWFGFNDHSGDKLRYNTDEVKKSYTELESRLTKPQADWINPYLGNHYNQEIGGISINKSADGNYILKAGNYETVLMRYDGADGRQSLMFTNPPFAGFEIFPMDGRDGTLELVRAQERYVFHRGENR